MGKLFEGKEVQGKIGEVGEYYADVNEKLVVEVGMVVKVDLIAEMHKLAAKSQSKVPEQVVSWIEGALVAANAAAVLQAPPAP